MEPPVVSAPGVVVKTVTLDGYVVRGLRPVKTYGIGPGVIGHSVIQFGGLCGITFGRDQSGSVCQRDVISHSLNIKFSVAVQCAGGV